MAGNVTLCLNFFAVFQCDLGIFQSYLFNIVAAFYIEINISVVIACIYLIDKIVYQSALKFKVVYIALQDCFHERYYVRFGEFLPTFKNQLSV